MGTQNVVRALVDFEGLVDTFIGDVSDSEAVKQESLAEESLKDGQRWTFRTNLDIGAGDKQVVIKNDLSDDILRVVALQLASDNQFSGSVQGVPTVDTAGSDIAFQPGRQTDTAGTLPSGIVVETGGTYSATGTTLPIRTTGGSGSGPARTGLEGVPASDFRLAPGGGVLYSFADESGSGNILTFEAIIARRPPVE